jgi:hypothetical protein
MKQEKFHTKDTKTPKAKIKLIFAYLAQNLRANAKEVALENTNKHYVECENCIYMYHCERTYMGGCDTGVEWEKEEKEKDEY